jgi:hypothetical protein
VSGVTPAAADPLREAMAGAAVEADAGAALAQLLAATFDTLARNISTVLRPSGGAEASATPVAAFALAMTGLLRQRVEGAFPASRATATATTGGDMPRA